jgi:hypothetical protein
MGVEEGDAAVAVRGDHGLANAGQGRGPSLLALQQLGAQLLDVVSREQAPGRPQTPGPEEGSLHDHHRSIGGARLLNALDDAAPSSTA